MKNKSLLMILVLSFTSVFSHTKFLEEKIYILPEINKIPKIIHQIWVGNKEIPDRYLEFMETWKTHHPDWKYILWTDKDIEDFPWINKSAFSKAKNPAMKADIWRIEILYQYGGVYVDADMECLRPLDNIHNRLNGYVGWDGTSKKIIANSIIGSKEKATILKKLIHEIKNNMNKIKDITTISGADIQSFTGPGSITRVIRRNKNLCNNKFIIFSNEYFQPVHYGRGGVPKTKKEMFDLENVCFANHHNGCSWAGSEFFPPNKN